MAKRKPHKRVSASTRLADMASTRMKAKQAAKKYGVSFWTIYGWKKSRNAGKGGKSAKKSGVTRSTGKASSRSTGSFGETLRPLIAQIVREEMARLVG